MAKYKWNAETKTLIPKDGVEAAPVIPQAPVYDSMTDEQLTVLATEHGIDTAKIKTRVALIEALEKAGQ